MSNAHETLDDETLHEWPTCPSCGELTSNEYFGEPLLCDDCKKKES